MLLAERSVRFAEGDRGGLIPPRPSAPMDKDDLSNLHYTAYICLSETNRKNRGPLLLF